VQWDAGSNGASFEELVYFTSPFTSFQTLLSYPDIEPGKEY
jgi:hypothetical protein